MAYGGILCSAFVVLNLVLCFGSGQYCCLVLDLVFLDLMMKDGVQGKATVLSKQPKRTGVSGDWLNVHVDGDEEPSSLNWKHVIEWKSLPPPEKVVLLTATQSVNQNVLDAKY